MGLLRKGRPDRDLGTGDLSVDALTWVNSQRRAYGREEIDAMPKGIPGSTLRCPISIAFEDIFGPGLVLTTPAYLRRASGLDIITTLPKRVTLFVAKFDDRGYPDLIEDDRPKVAHFLYVPDDWAENYYNLGHCA